ncbi:death-on-curing protein [Paraburkholderia sp. BL6669N2]|uniref:type II toxin-antitoxin system death-on-curing family toxin n=1 Tax=Paraburkholderia sp. BL6669N2 TaxID=1938807 RepID=UPI000E2822C7|nr:type II toxin-antitoxin system death-on-curing family toxin [Paraburkholderia sp. BL6669N2]REG61526.1 death-on-curing protein [Paraburkholderia sp. BL6669N2]
MLDAAFVLQIHDEILRDEPGLAGFAGPGFAGLESALTRIDNWAAYANLNDVFGTASMYAVAIARGHIFNDANKRTALVAALTYLKLQEIDVERDARLEDLMVEVAKGAIEVQEFANILAGIALGIDDFDAV